MSATWSWRLLWAASVALGLCWAGPSWADEKGQKDSDKGKEDKKVIVIQLDLSKAPPGLVKQLVELSKSPGKDADKKGGKEGKDAGKKGGKKDDEGDKKKDSKKRDADKKKGADKKANIIQVDLNKLPPDLAKRLRAELAKGKEDGKKSSQKDDEDDDQKKKGGKKGDDEDDDRSKKTAAKKGGKKKDD